MIRICLIFLIIPIILYSCSPIKKENRIGVIAKIIHRKLFYGNGSKEFVYYYLGKRYFNFDSFDARYFDYNDMFLLFIDKTNPEKNQVPYPTQKIMDPRKFDKTKGLEYYLDENDLEKLENFE